MRWAFPITGRCLFLKPDPSISLFVLEGWEMIQERLGELDVTCDVAVVPEWLADLELPPSCRQKLTIRRFLQYP